VSSGRQRAEQEIFAADKILASMSHTASRPLKKKESCMPAKIQSQNGLKET